MTNFSAGQAAGNHTGQSPENVSAPPCEALSGVRKTTSSRRSDCRLPGALNLSDWAMWSTLAVMCSGDEARSPVMTVELRRVILHTHIHNS